MGRRLTCPCGCWAESSYLRSWVNKRPHRIAVGRPSPSDPCWLCCELLCGNTDTTASPSSSSFGGCCCWSSSSSSPQEQSTTAPAAAPLLVTRRFQPPTTTIALPHPHPPPGRTEVDPLNKSILPVMSVLLGPFGHSEATYLAVVLLRSKGLSVHPSD
jgi:hypothetical protein